MVTETSWIKGQSGNPNGRPKKEISITEILRNYLENVPAGEEKTYKELFVRKLVDLSIRGDIAAMKLIFSYLEGIPKSIDNSLQKNIDFHLVRDSSDNH